MSQQDRNEELDETPEGGRDSLSSALELAKQGWKVFPCRPGEKTPLTAHGFKDATSDEEEIAKLFRTGDENIGIATGEGLFVLDVDRKEGLPDGMTSLESLMKQHEPLPVTATAMTPSGGRHYYFTTIEEFRNSVGRVAPSLDVRSDGGYVVGPGSVVAGNAYQWAPGCSPEEVGVAPLPDWLGGLAKRASPPAYSGNASGESNGNKIPEGTRNSSLTSLAGLLRDRGVSPEAIKASLHLENRDKCSPPLPDDEVDKIAQSIMRYEPSNSYVVEEDDDEEIEETTDPGALPPELLQVPGFIGEVVQWNLATAYRRQPNLALGGAFALLSALTGRKIADAHDTRTNLYILGICPSAMGKERARQVNKAILYQSGQQELIGPEEFASSAGLISSLNHHPCQLFQIDEIGRMLKAITARNAGNHLAGIITELLKLYTSSNSIYLGRAYADPKFNVTIDQPHATVYGTTVADSFFAGLTTEGLADGFYGRLLAFTGAKEKRRTNHAAAHTVPDNILQAARYWGEFSTGGVGGLHPQPVVVAHSKAGLQAAEHHLDAFERLLLSDSATGASAIWGRAGEKMNKLALLYACSECHESPEITSNAVQWAAAIVEHQTTWMLHMASQWVAENEFENSLKRVLRIITAAGQQGITKRALGRKTQWLKPRERFEILSELLDVGTIEEVTRVSATKPAVVYRKIRQRVKA